ncbi:MAG TPA: hypothetical protein VNN74_02815 [Candidatus Micrarchaeia archaeon]|nr:hypothetical protein [Candidatus Micrarchaeia archaeon]
MVVVKESWQLPHAPGRVRGRLTGPAPLGDRFPGLEPPAAPGEPGRLRIRLGPAQVTLAGRAEARALTDPAGDPTVLWEVAGRRPRGPGSGRARVSLGLVPDGGGTLVHILAEAELSDWDDPPGDAAVEAALRRLLASARRGLTRMLDADPTVPAATGERHSPIGAVDPASAARPGCGVHTQGDRLRHLARERWPVGLLLVGAGAALAAWLGPVRRRLR